MIQKKSKRDIFIILGYICIFLVLSMVMLVGCNHSMENDNQPQVLESEEVLESTEIETVTEEIETLETTVVEESTITEENTLQFSEEQSEVVEFVLDTGINEECTDPYTLLGTAPSKEIIDGYGYQEGHSVLRFDIVPQTMQECEEYYVVDAVYAKAIEAPGNLAMGERVTLVFNELTGDERTLERREDGLHQLEDAENEPYYPTYFHYWVREDGSPVVLYDENSDRVDKPVYEGKLYIRKDATIESVTSYDIKAVTKEALNREDWFNGVYFDENGYVTRLVYYGD